MKSEQVAHWMLTQLEKEGCLYQDDVVDYLVKSGENDLLRENAQGNLVLNRTLLAAFRKITETTVVWVKPDRYWRMRVPEDEVGRDARG